MNNSRQDKQIFFSLCKSQSLQKNKKMKNLSTFRVGLLALKPLPAYFVSVGFAPKRATL